APMLVGRSRGGAVQPRRLKLYAGYGAAVSVSLVFELTLSMGDRFLVAGFLGEAATGVYAAGYGLANRLIEIVFLWLAMAGAPLTIAALEQDGEAGAKAMAARFANLLVLIGVPAATGLALVAEPLSAVMVGVAFRADAARIIPWIAAGGLLNGLMTHYVHDAFILARRPRAMAGCTAAAAVVNVALNLWWMPLFGLIGVAAATVAAYGFGLGLCAVIGRRFFPLPLPFGAVLRASGAALIMALAVRLCPATDHAFLDLIVQAGLGALVYALAALALNVGDCRAWIGPARARVLRPAP
ncbi:MAG: lipopolysaccharide biosynthesis protein, partial [Maricaulaceae bacterium]